MNYTGDLLGVSSSDIASKNTVLFGFFFEQLLSRLVTCHTLHIFCHKWHILVLTFGAGTLNLLRFLVMFCHGTVAVIEWMRGKYVYAHCDLTHKAIGSI